MAIIGGGKTPVNGEIIASGIRRKCVVGHHSVATTVAPLGKPAPPALTWFFGFPITPQNVKHVTRDDRIRRYRRWAGSISFERAMSTRRLAYWWFWFVASGRFLQTFLTRPRVKRP
jgi:hypothetical protein